MKILLVAFGLALALTLSACGGLTCSEACSKAQACGVLTGPLGTDAETCRSRCEQAAARVREGTVNCISKATCDDLRQGRCGSW